MATVPRLIKGMPALAEQLGMPLSTVETAHREGELPSIKIAGRHYFDPVDVSDWLDQHRTVR